jgi:hypothetical protein
MFLIKITKQKRNKDDEEVSELKKKTYSLIILTFF